MRRIPNSMPTVSSTRLDGLFSFVRQVAGGWITDQYQNCLSQAQVNDARIVSCMSTIELSGSVVGEKPASSITVLTP